MLIFRLSLFLALFVVSDSLFAQKIKVATATYELRQEDNMTKNQAQDKAVLYARLKAIKEVFGESLVQNNSIYISNSEGAGGAKSSQLVASTAETYLNGEWVEDIDAPVIKWKIIDNESWVSATVKGKVKERSEKNVSFKVKTLSCPKTECETNEFNENQDFFVEFITPSDGYLSIYLEVPTENMAYRLLPYKANKSESCVKVSSDIPYTFFSEELNNLMPAVAVDELSMSLTNKNHGEQNTLVFLFSKTRFESKPIFIWNSQKEAEMDAIPGLGLKDFQTWHLKLERELKTMQSTKLSFLIKPN